MYGKIQVSGLTEFSPFICTSAIWGQILADLVMMTSCIPTPHPHPSGSSALTLGMAASAGSQTCSLLGVLIPIWRPQIIDGYDISCPPVW